MHLDASIVSIITAIITATASIAVAYISRPKGPRQ